VAVIRELVHCFGREFTLRRDLRERSARTAPLPARRNRSLIPRLAEQDLATHGPSAGTLELLISKQGDWISDDDGAHPRDEGLIVQGTVGQKAWDR
jgi:hypothetical protein